MEYNKITELIAKVVLQDEVCENRDELWRKIEAQCFEGSSVVACLGRRRAIIWQLAASVTAILLVASGFHASQNNYSADNKDLVITLPDHSRTTLYAGSTLNYNSVIWLFNRTVTLQGKARFEGEHANGFKIKTSLGEVRVLGTEFLIDDKNEVLVVECFSGSVCVSTSKGEQILEEGEQVTYNNSSLQFAKISKQWAAYIEFDNRPLGEVLAVIEEMYDVHFEGVSTYNGYTYSGVVPSKNLEQALELVFGSCNIAYTLSGNEVILGL